MAGVASIGNKLTRIIEKAENKPINDNQQTNRLYSKWEGSGQKAFKGAYQGPPNLCKKIKMQAESAKSKLSSLDNAIQSAERDMKEKKEKAKSKRR